MYLPPPPHPSEKREGKTTPTGVNLKEKACVPCPFLKKRGHCLKGDKFSRKFTLPHKCESNAKQNPYILPIPYTPYVQYPNNNPLVAPLPFNSFQMFPPPNLYYPNDYLPPFPSNLITSPHSDTQHSGPY